MTRELDRNSTLGKNIEEFFRFARSPQIFFGRGGISGKFSRLLRIQIEIREVVSVETMRFGEVVK